MEHVPSLARRLARLFVVAWSMENGDAQVTVCVDIWMADVLGKEFKGRWLIGIFGRETHIGLYEDLSVG